jgi:hypothetical protein
MFLLPLLGWLGLGALLLCAVLFTFFEHRNTLKRSLNAFPQYILFGVFGCRHVSGQADYSCCSYALRQPESYLSVYY